MRVKKKNFFLKENFLRFKNKDAFFKSKKGQLTIFVILGVVILLSVGSMMYFSYANNKSAIDADFRKFSGKVQSGQIQTFVESCVQSVGNPAIKMMATRGGRLNIPVDEFYLPQIPVTGVNAKMVPAVASLTASKLIDLPLAYFNGENHFPSINEMEEELSNHMEVQVKRCIDSFKPFSHDLEFIEKKELEVETRISQEKVSFVLKYPILFNSKDGQRTFNFDKFHSDVNIRLGRLHNLSVELINYESETDFLENTVLEILAISDLPYEGLEIDCGKKSWHILELEEQFKPYVQHNIRNLRFENTKLTDNEFENDYYKNLYSVDFTDNDYTDFRVETYYNNFWPLNLDVSPSSKGNRVGPLDTGIKKFLMCIKTYHHKYDFFFPVLFRVVDEYKNDKTIFNLVIPVSIRKGKPFDNDVFVPYGRIEELIDNDAYCREDEFVSPIEIKAIDTESLKLISNVSLKYSCSNYACEDVGLIDYPRMGNVRIPGKKPMFKGNLPECAGGLLTLTSKGYEDKTVQIDTVRDEYRDDSVLVKMTPAKDYKIKVKLVTDINNPSVSRDLRADEFAIVNMYKSDSQEEYTAYYPINSSEDSSFKLSQDVKNKDYEFDVLVYKSDKSFVNAIDVFDSGNVVGGSAVYNVTFLRDDLEDSNELVLYALTNLPLPQSTNEFFEFYQNVDVDLMSNNLRPELK